MSTAVADTGFVLSTVQCSMSDGVDVAATAVAVVASAATAATESSAAVRLMFKVPPGLVRLGCLTQAWRVAEAMSGSTRRVTTGGQASEPRVIYPGRVIVGVHATSWTSHRPASARGDGAITRRR